MDLHRGGEEEAEGKNGGGGRDGQVVTWEGQSGGGESPRVLPTSESNTKEPSPRQTLSSFEAE